MQPLIFTSKLLNIHLNFTGEMAMACKHAIFEVGKYKLIISIYHQSQIRFSFIKIHQIPNLYPVTILNVNQSILNTYILY